jgi:Chitobiase/beta-hexosaminidase C-terminal domain
MTPSPQVSAWFTKEAAGVITLAWVDNAANEDGFGIERKTGTNGTFTRIATVGSNVNSYTDSGLTAGNTYCYRVNTAGASAYTNETCKTMPTATVTIVATPTFSPAGGTFTDSVIVTLQTATSGASVYYTIDGSAPTESSTPYTGQITLTSNTVLNAKAFRAGSNPSGQASASFTIVEPLAQLTLSWNDNSNNESNFEIERKTGTSGTYARVTLVGANANSYVDTTVTRGVTYCYRVRAVNSTGASAYANEACGTAAELQVSSSG